VGAYGFAPFLAQVRAAGTASVLWETGRPTLTGVHLWQRNGSTGTPATTTVAGVQVDISEQYQPLPNGGADVALDPAELAMLTEVHAQVCTTWPGRAAPGALPVKDPNGELTAVDMLWWLLRSAADLEPSIVEGSGYAGSPRDYRLLADKYLFELSTDALPALADAVGKIAATVGDLAVKVGAIVDPPGAAQGLAEQVAATLAQVRVTLQAAAPPSPATPAAAVAELPATSAPLVAPAVVSRPVGAEIGAGMGTQLPTQINPTTTGGTT
jgi:hypothetical protein